MMKRMHLMLMVEKKMGKTDLSKAQMSQNIDMSKEVRVPKSAATTPAQENEDVSDAQTVNEETLDTVVQNDEKNASGASGREQIEKTEIENETEVIKRSTHEKNAKTVYKAMNDNTLSFKNKNSIKELNKAVSTSQEKVTNIRKRRCSKCQNKDSNKTNDKKLSSFQSKKTQKESLKNSGSTNKNKIPSIRKKKCSKCNIKELDKLTTTKPSSSKSKTTQNELKKSDSKNEKEFMIRKKRCSKCRVYENDKEMGDKPEALQSRNTQEESTQDKESPENNHIPHSLNESLDTKESSDKSSQSKNTQEESMQDKHSPENNHVPHSSNESLDTKESSDKSSQSKNTQEEFTQGKESPGKNNVPYNLKESLDSKEESSDKRTSLGISKYETNAKAKIFPKENIATDTTRKKFRDTFVKESKSLNDIHLSLWEQKFTASKDLTSGISKQSPIEQNSEREIKTYEGKKAAFSLDRSTQSSTGEEDAQIFENQDDAKFLNIPNDLNNLKSRKGANKDYSNTLQKEFKSSVAETSGTSGESGTETDSESVVESSSSNQSSNDYNEPTDSQKCTPKTRKKDISNTVQTPEMNDNLNEEKSPKDSKETSKVKLSVNKKVPSQKWKSSNNVSRDFDKTMHRKDTDFKKNNTGIEKAGTKRKSSQDNELRKNDNKARKDFIQANIAAVSSTKLRNFSLKIKNENTKTRNSRTKLRKQPVRTKLQQPGKTEGKLSRVENSDKGKKENSTSLSRYSSEEIKQSESGFDSNFSESRNKGFSAESFGSFSSSSNVDNEPVVKDGGPSKRKKQSESEFGSNFNKSRSKGSSTESFGSFSSSSDVDDEAAVMKDEGISRMRNVSFFSEKDENIPDKDRNDSKLPRSDSKGLGKINADVVKKNSNVKNSISLASNLNRITSQKILLKFIHGLPCPLESTSNVRKAESLRGLKSSKSDSKTENIQNQRRHTVPDVEPHGKNKQIKPRWNASPSLSTIKANVGYSKSPKKYKEENVEDPAEMTEHKLPDETVNVNVSEKDLEKAENTADISVHELPDEAVQVNACANDLIFSIHLKCLKPEDEAVVIWLNNFPEVKKQRILKACGIEEEAPITHDRIEDGGNSRPKLTFPSIAFINRLAAEAAGENQDDDLKNILYKRCNLPHVEA